jgi:hypothetical protein
MCTFAGPCEKYENNKMVIKNSIFASFFIPQLPWHKTIDIFFQTRKYFKIHYDRIELDKKVEKGVSILNAHNQYKEKTCNDNVSTSRVCGGKTNAKTNTRKCRIRKTTLSAATNIADNDDKYFRTNINKLLQNYTNPGRKPKELYFFAEQLSERCDHSTFYLRLFCYVIYSPRLLQSPVYTEKVYDKRYNTRVIFFHRFPPSHLHKQHWTRLLPPISCMHALLLTAAQFRRALITAVKFHFLYGEREAQLLASVDTVSKGKRDHLTAYRFAFPRPMTSMTDGMEMWTSADTFPNIKLTATQIEQYEVNLLLDTTGTWGESTGWGYDHTCKKNDYSNQEEHNWKHYKQDHQAYVEAHVRQNGLIDRQLDHHLNTHRTYAASDMNYEELTTWMKKITETNELHYARLCLVSESNLLWNPFQMKVFSNIFEAPTISKSESVAAHRSSHYRLPFCERRGAIEIARSASNLHRSNTAAEMPGSSNGPIGTIRSPLSLPHPSRLKSDWDLCRMYSPTWNSDFLENL